MSNDGWFDYFANVHNNVYNNVHSNVMFNPFHRYFVLLFEQTAKGYDSRFVMPYWDAAADFADPASSVVLSDKYVGGRGDPNDDFCVKQGPQANMTVSIPNPHCLARIYNNGKKLNPWYSPEAIAHFIQISSDMSMFRNYIEDSIHGSVHLAIAGDMLYGWAAADFVFFLHHANMDRIWSIWQGIGDHQMMMDGNGPGGRPLSLDDSLTFYQNETVRSTMRLGYGKYCYRYDDEDIDGFYKPVASNKRFSRRNADTKNSALPKILSSRQAMVKRIHKALSPEEFAYYFPEWAKNYPHPNTGTNKSPTQNPSGINVNLSGFVDVDIDIDIDLDDIDDAVQKLICLPILSQPKDPNAMSHMDPGSSQKLYNKAKELAELLNGKGYSTPF
ncbi:hypothetical protein H4219_003820 [Mycoemilia scoparia]|uniref:Tyrosinase copper-binding domain-containing protein n=1 Tax=Mycoemilia scoparia TaxID=417184 RepID=A0A9W7ZZ73_9FUNG|nr:hypothetical protein H4219_003820 [Mycoemilia scoparia]